MTVEDVKLHAHPSKESCPYCHAAFSRGEETWPCDRCGTKLHAECSRENGLRCPVFACRGRIVGGPEARCARCDSSFTATDEVWACGTCGERGHADCFRRHNLVCARGCWGPVLLPTGAPVRPPARVSPLPVRHIVLFAPQVAVLLMVFAQVRGLPLAMGLVVMFVCAFASLALWPRS